MQLEGSADSTGFRPRVVIVGGGFGGIATARALRDLPVDILVIDRQNHHVFQPLLYQVATASLAAADIAAPIRRILHKQTRTMVAMAEVTGIDVEGRRVLTSSSTRGELAVPYDYLVVATGVEQSYFGHPEFVAFAPGLKSVVDAEAVRAKLLRAYERAEIEEDPSQHRDLLTFVLVGAGPTGVELAGAIAEMARATVRSDFRRVDPRMTRILLLDAGPRILAGFDERLAQKAHARLKQMGVEIRTKALVEQIDEKGVVVGGERITSQNVLWTAGVKASPAGSWLRADTDRVGRVRVGSDLTVQGRPEVFVIGDTAILEENGKPLPGVAQVAIQQGSYVARAIAAHVVGGKAPEAFHYSDRGNMAVIGRNFAILESHRIKLSGFPAWAAWATIHLGFLPQHQNRRRVLITWAGAYFTGERAARLILERRSGPPAPATASLP
ncbi:MAG TPA: NAD(P)/FAD-dependent oxidoreductase [Myxococcota bacterium]|nr:NAD(P)/FAD-dependent oxidoreductase [Myxococcota bacterium]